MTHSPASPPETGSPFADHDHARCQSDVLAVVDRKCREAGLRLTPVRRQVLEILLEAHTGLGAYAVLAKLNEDGRGAQPPVVYRALDFLVAHGFAHRIESLNAFIGCACPGETHRPAFLICRDCQKVAETKAAPARDALTPDADALGFRVDAVSVEARGLCPACAPADDAA